MFSLSKTLLIFSGYTFATTIFGFLLSIFTPNGKLCKHITGFTMEFSSGFTISMVFLSLIPSAYTLFKAEELILFLILGIFSAMLMQERVKYRYRKMSSKQRLSATEKLSAWSAFIGNLARGLAVGTGAGLSSGLGFGLGIAAAIYVFPESFSVFLMSKTSEKSVFSKIFFCFLPTAAFLCGEFCGAYIGSFSNDFMARILLFAGGFTLYSAVGDVSIESKLLYHGRFIPFFNILGMILGTALVLSS